MLLKSSSNDLTNSVNQSTGSTVQSVCSKLLIDTVKRDISSMETSYELNSLPLYRCSNQFQAVNISESRILERTGFTLTKSTPLDMFLIRAAEDRCSWYQFVCKQGKVSVMSGRATWPLNEDCSITMELVHWPNWREICDIKVPDLTWTQIMPEGLASKHCPDFVIADLEKSKTSKTRK